MGESEGIVRALIEEVLEDVCSKSEWDLTNGRPPKGEGAGKGSGVNLCGVMRQRYPSRVLDNYSVWEGRVEVLHLRCAEQKASGEVAE